MTEEQIALARRAVACKGWRWMCGMATDEGHRVVLVDTDIVWMVYDGEGKCKPGCVEDFVPDLTDPATLGCLLALVREAHGKPLAFAFSEDEGMWEIGVVRRYYDHFVDTLRTGGSWGYTEGQGEVVYEPSEAHVLVRALEVADAFHATKETA